MEDIKQLEQSTDIFKKYGAKYAALFGSRARGEAGPDSDFDILVKLEKPIGLFSFSNFQLELEDRLKRKVDLVSEGGLNSKIREFVMRDLKIFYGHR
ncbi:MAG: nucleotidyltransferase family protein [Candidatus Vogelbacteria bacterium]|nr:nucleotidyltransferase family protein [Candidatus Vogelbacteria bacterium]